MTTECQFSLGTSTGAPYATTIKVAIAGNFFDPAGMAMATNFINQLNSQSPVPSVCIKLYPNSTGVLQSEIAIDPYLYDILFAVDMVSKDFLDQLPGLKYTPFRYAIGIPVLFALRSIGTVNNLISGTSGTYEASIPNVTTAYVIKNAASVLAVADPSNAPYGDVGMKILAKIGKDSTLVIDSVSYETVIAVENAVENGLNGVHSGFVARSQIYLERNYVTYVEFPQYPMNQEALQLTAKANALVSYIQAEINNDNWDAFLTYYGYDPLP